MSDGQVSLLQIGARRNYVAARQLQEAGLLYAIVCDTAWHEQRIPSYLSFLARRSARFAGRLSRRSITGVPPQKIRPSVLPNAAQLSRHFVPAEKAHALADDALGWSVPRDVMASSAVILSCFGNGGSFLRRSKEEGKLIVTDFISHPHMWKMICEERTRWPGLERSDDGSLNRWYYEDRVAHLVELSDIYLCPSASVAEGLRDVPGFKEGCARIVPYGLSGFTVVPNTPEPGRILFAASSVSLLKGIMYLAEAERRLAETGIDTTVFVAGQVPAHWPQRPEFQGLQFLGHLTAEQMRQQLAKADVFCLPSLAEGSATSIFEAMAHGLPVVTTRASGSVVRDGREGHIVPPRNSTALSDALASIIQDRPKRQQMSACARATAARFSDRHCGELFTEVIMEALAMSGVRSPHNISNRAQN